MVQTTNRFFDEFARLMNDATGVAQGVRREVDTVFRTQAERILRDLDVVSREEFEVVKEMARLAREENEALKARIAALEAGQSKV
jgi:BMFP domain-containing protein YqiC